MGMMGRTEAPYGGGNRRPLPPKEMERRYEPDQPTVNQEQSARFWQDRHEETRKRVYAVAFDFPTSDDHSGLDGGDSSGGCGGGGAVGGEDDQHSGLSRTDSFASLNGDPSLDTIAEGGATPCCQHEVR